MITKTPEFGENGVFVYADGGVMQSYGNAAGRYRHFKAEKARFTAGSQKSPKWRSSPFLQRGVPMGNLL